VLKIYAVNVNVPIVTFSVLFPLAMFKTVDASAFKPEWIVLITSFISD